MNAIVAEELHVSYGGRPALWNISLQVPRGQWVGILGPNGAGKSTLLKTALGLISPLSGHITLTSGKGKVAYVPQRESIDWDFPVTAFEVVLMGRYPFFGRGLLGRPRAADREAAQHTLSLLGMAPFMDKPIGELSGGQQQKLFIARAMVQDPDIYLLDEPFMGVDVTTEEVIFAQLKKERERGKSIVMVHHDLSSVPHSFDWVILLNRLLIASGPTREVFTAEALQKTFGASHPLWNEAAILSGKTREGE